MTHISKKQLKKEFLNELFNQLSKVIAQLNIKEADLFFDELLGDEEKIMLAKRLAAIVMCVEGNSAYRISQLLLMSPSTTERIRLNYQIGKYSRMEQVITKRKKEYEEFWRVLDVILRAGMPPRGKGRWKSVFKHLK